MEYDAEYDAVVAAVVGGVSQQSGGKIEGGRGSVAKQLQTMASEAAALLGSCSSSHAMLEAARSEEGPPSPQSPAAADVAALSRMAQVCPPPPSVPVWAVRVAAGLVVAHRSWRRHSPPVLPPQRTTPTKGHREVKFTSLPR